MKKLFSLAAALCIMLGIVLLNTSSISSFMEEDGFVMPKTSIEEMMSDRTTVRGDTIDLIEVDYSEMILEKSNRFYNEKNKELDLRYPVVIRDHTALKFMQSSSYLISHQFDYLPVIENMTVVDQSSFNSDGSQADLFTYILAQLENGLYVSTIDFTITTRLDTFQIPKHSILHFDAEFVNVYTYESGIYKFQAIRGLQDASIKYDDMETAYDDFYKSLFNVKEKIKALDPRSEEVIKEKIKKEKLQPQNPVDNSDIPSELVPNGQESETPGEPGDPITPTYVKPTVAIHDISAWVYSVDGKIEVNDPAGRINRGVVLNVYNESGSLLLRQQINRSGWMHLVTLPPDTIVYVEAYFQYYDEKSRLISETVIEGVKLKTLPMVGHIAPVDLNFEKTKTPEGNQMSVEQMTLKNTTDYDANIDTLENFYKNTLPYVYQMTFSFTDEEGNVINMDVNNSTLAKLKKGQSLHYATGTKLKSNTKYHYEVRIYDRFGNELPLRKKVEGKYTTCKATPSVTAKVVSNAMYNFEFQMGLEDEDKALSEHHYIVQIFDGDTPLELDYSYGNESGNSNEIKLSNATNNTRLKITNLPLERSLTLYAYGSYDLSDGQGIQERKEIGKLVFYSSGLPNGSLTYNNSFTDIGGSFATINIDMAQTSTVALVNLLSEFDITIETTGQTLTTTISKDEINQVNIEKNYNNEKKALKIQTGNRINKTPTIWLKADKNCLLNQGVWQTFINSALLGKHNEASGTLHIEYLQGTLLSSSKYTYSMTSNADLGIRVFDVDNFWSENEFYTFNSDAIVSYDDFFLAQDFIELYDVRVEDIDKTIGNETYVVQLLEDGQLVNSKTLSSVETHEKVRFEGLQVDKEYTLRFAAPIYYSTNNHEEFLQDFELKSQQFLQREGVQASIQVSNMASSYTSSMFTTAYVKDKGEGVALNATYDVASRSVIKAQDTFISDFIEYKPSVYSLFRSFGSTSQKIMVIGFNKDKAYTTNFSTTGAYLYSIDPYSSGSFFSNTNIKYIRIVGNMGYENLAQYIQFTENNVREIANVEKNPDQFVDGVMNGTTGNDSISINTSSTDFIKCEAGELLFVQSSLTKNVTFYDKGKDYITTFSGGYNVIEIPSNAKYMRIRVTDLDKNKHAIKYSILNGSENRGFIGSVEWTLNDTLNDQFFVHNEKNKIDTYKLSKYSTTDLVNMEFKKTEYIRDSKLTYDSAGNVAVNDYSQEKFSPNQGFKYDISIQYHGREVILDSIQFKSDRNIHILSSGYDMPMIPYDPSGYFIAVNDIEEISGYTFTNIIFSGELDFQGHTFTQTTNNTNSLFWDTLEDTVIKNMRIVSTSYLNRYLIQSNRGTLDNIIYVIEQNGEDNVKEVQSSLVGTNNYTGVISNFIVQINGNIHLNVEDPMTIKGILTRSNYGMIKNGYIYNTSPEGKVYIYNSGGLITGTNHQSGIIRNVYALCDIYANYDANTSGMNYSSGVIAGKNNAGKIRDVFGVSTRYKYIYDADTMKFTDLEASNYDDPLFGAASNVNTDSRFYENVYLSSSHKDYKKLYSTYFNKNNLYDSKWYHHNIASLGAFEIDSTVSVGYYPQLKMNPLLMKYQTYLPLPKKEEVKEPVIRDVQVTKQGVELVEILLKFDNPNKYVIKEIETGYLQNIILQQGEVDGSYEVKLQVSDPSVFVTGYTLSSFTYQSDLSKQHKVDTDIALDIAFYSPIKKLEDWKNMRNHPNYNYRLANDLDFGEVDITKWNSEVYLANFTGKLDGGRYNVQGELVGNYELKNLNLENSNLALNGILMGNVTNAEIKNLKITNVKWERLNNNSYGALFYNSSYAIFDNIHIRNVSLTSRLRIAPLLSTANYTTVQNCSANNVVLRNTSDTSSGIYMGGLIGVSENSTIRNSYVSGLDMKTNNVDISKSVGVGGISGSGNIFSRFETCYAIGSITNTSYNGGIVGVGNPTISQVYSNVKIEADGDFNGGISGSNSSDVRINNTLSVGDFVIALKDISYSNRISALTNFYDKRNNFAYSEQLMNNEKFELSDAMQLLSYQDLSNENTYRDVIGLGASFDYEAVENGRLPKVKDTNGNVLANQPNSYLISDSIGMSVDSAHYDSVDTFTTYLTLTHRGYSVDEIMIDGMELKNKPELIAQEDGWSRYKLESSKTQAFDIYRARASLSNNSDAENKIEIVATVDYGKPIYWEIETASQWQSIMKTRYNTNENIKIVGEIDFSGIKDPILGVMVNRLDGKDEATSIIKGLNFTDASTSKNFVATVLAETKNLGFEDITYDLKTYNGSRAALYGKIQGKASNLTFQNIHMNLDNITSSYIGMIASISGQLSNITLDDISIKGKTPSYRNVMVGALAGLTESGISNVKASNIKVDIVNGSYIGGLVGQAIRSDTNLVEINGVHIIQSEVKGNNYVGGAFGEVSANGLPIYNISAKEMNIDQSVSFPLDTTSNNTIGGLIGKAHLANAVINNANLDEYAISDSTIRGQSYVGGVVGELSSGELVKLQVHNIDVLGNKAVGGLTGLSRNVYVSNSTVYESNIEAMEKMAGGLIGSGTHVRNSQAIEVNVKAPQYAGGVAGAAGYYNNLTLDTMRANQDIYYYENAVLDSEIQVSDKGVGGIAGYEYGSGSGIYRNAVKNTNISSVNGYAGGIVGTLHSSNIFESYIDGGAITSTGDYTGGIVGYAKLDTLTDEIIYPAQIYRSYSNTAIEGKAYTGGVFGYYDTIQTSTSATIRELFGLTSYSTVNGTQHTYAIGYIEPESIQKLNPLYFGAFHALDTSKVNGVVVSEDTLSNMKDPNIYKILTHENLTNYSYLTATIANGGMIQNPANANGFVTTASTLETFAISQKETVSNNQYSFLLNGIDLPDGDYLMKVSPTSGTITYKNDTNSDGFDEVTITNGQLDYTFGANSIGTNKHFTFHIYDAQTKELEYANAVIKNISSVYNVVPMLVDNNPSIYQYSENSDAITLSVDDTSDTYRWFRVYSEQGYNNNIVEVSAFANGNSLTTNVAGVYYAQATNNANKRSQLFTYDGLVYLPQVSSATVGANVGFQNGYTILPSGKIVENYKKDMNFMDATVIGHANKKPMVNTAQIQESLKLPKVSVYSSGINTINIELDESVPYQANNQDLNMFVTIGEEEASYEVEGRVLSLCYDYQKDIQVEVSNGVETSETIVSANDVRKTISTYDDSYYYLTSQGVVKEDGIMEGDFIHIYEKEALDQTGKIHDLETQTWHDIPSKNLEQFDTKALYTSEYETTTLLTFQNFTYNVLTDATQELVMYAKDSRFMVVDGVLDQQGTSLISDQYDENSYLAYLSTDGNIVQLQDEMEMPSKFKNKQIVEMNDNYQSDSDIVLVRYDNGTVAAFHYVTGEEITLPVQDEPTLMEYAKMMLDDLWKPQKMDASDAYQQSQDLQRELNALSKEQWMELYKTATIQSDDVVLDEVEGSPQLITVFNATTNEYDIYDTNKLLTSSNEVISETQIIDEVISETQIIDEVGETESLRLIRDMVATREKVTKGVNISGIVLFVSVVCFLMVLLFVLKNRVKRNKKLNLVK